MKYINSLFLIAVLVFAASCNDDKTSVDFGLNASTLEFGPEGGAKNIRVSADKSWTASTDQPWILISPANGNASTECKIRIDSTLVDYQQNGTVVFSIEGQERRVQVSREGFPLAITIPDGSQTISIPDYADVDNAHFDVEVSANVEFKIDIPEEVTWIRTEDFKQVTPIGCRPRTTKIRFLWDINSKPFQQDAQIAFKPTVSVVRQDAIKVTQGAAPLIEPSRKGDSLAILAIARNLKIWGTSFDSSKSMIYWDNVKLWDAKDPKAKENPSLIGRVKFVDFSFFSTKMSLPYEVKYLTAVDSISFFSNENRMLRNIELGPEICFLTQLRSLSIEAYGITKLPAEFKNLSNLEYLYIGSNNFQKLPLDIINKQNFPKLKQLSFNYMRTKEVYDLSNNVATDIGVNGPFPIELLSWDNLEFLSLGFCYLEGSIPTMENGPKYTEEDEAVKKGLTKAGVPKVLPNLKSLRINGARLTGSLPDWILHHPNLYEWVPYVFVFSQEGKDSKGMRAGFDNVPDSVDPPKKD